MNKIEALADSFAKASGWHDPESDAYRNRNPIQLPAISPRHPRDEQGKRIFKCALDGYQAALFDLKIKCSGQSNAGLRKDATLRDLALVYGHTPGGIPRIVRFLRRALSDESITEHTPLMAFLE